MEDQFTEEVKKRKEQGQSERQMAAELNVSRSKIHNVLQGLKLSESGGALVPEDKLREIIREELERARTAAQGRGRRNGDGQRPAGRLRAQG